MTASTMIGYEHHSASSMTLSFQKARADIGYDNHHLRGSNPQSSLAYLRDGEQKNYCGFHPPPRAR